MAYGFKNDISNLVNLERMLDKSTVYNVLAEGMYVLDKSPKTFWTFHCLSEVVHIPVIFEANFCIPKLCTIL